MHGKNQLTTMSMSNLKHPLCVAKNGSASVGKFRMGSETFNLWIRGTHKAEFARANLGVIFWWLACGMSTPTRARPR